MADIKIDDLADTIAEELEGYQQEITDGIKAAAKQAAEDCRRAIRKASPKRTGRYRKGWRVKKAYESQTDVRYVIHNATDYQLTHLLENGHAKVNGGRVAGIPHIEPAARKAAEELESKAKVVVKG